MKPIVLDFETHYAKDYNLRQKGMTFQKYIRDPRFKVHGCGIKLPGKKSVWVTAKLLPAVFAKIGKEHGWENLIVVGHNLGFDATILAWIYGIQAGMYIDTLALARAQLGANAVKKGLDDLGMAFCGSGKPEGLYATYGVYDLTPELETKLGAYCIDDCEKTWKLFGILMKGMDRTELEAFDWCTRTYLNPRFIIDTETMLAYIHELADKKERVLAECGLTDRTMLNSPELFAQALRDLGVDPPMKPSPKKKNEDGSPMMTYAFAKTDKGLKDLLDHEDYRVQALVAARLEVKSTNEENKAQAYYESGLLGAWPVSIKAAGAENTHRFSGDKHGGGNPQNIGRGSPIKNAICAPEGFVILDPDLSQIECRITLQLGAYHYIYNRTITDPMTCPEMEALETLRRGDDIYLWFGSRIYGFALNKKDHKEQRQVAKAAVLGLGFGMGWKRFIEHCRIAGIIITEAFAKKIVKLYRDTFPNVVKAWKASLNQMAILLQGRSIPAFKRMLDSTKAKLSDNIAPILVPENDPFYNEPALRMPNGQYLKYPQLTAEQHGRKVQWTYVNKGKVTFMHPGKFFENLVQALAGLIMRTNLVELQRRFKAADPSGVQGVQLSIHDSLPMLVYDDPAWIDWALEQVFDVMEKAPPWMPDLPVAIEVKKGYRYGEMEEVKRAA
jgi:hypothetical protein